MTSSLSSFKTLDFHSGLNVLLAEKRPDATNQQTRNRAGKTSFVELVHFLMGADADTKSIFRSSALNNHTFSLTFDLLGERVTVTRGGRNAAKVYLDEGTATHWPLQPTIEKGTRRRYISNTNWKTVLGHSFFALSDDDEAGEKWNPRFRSMFSYFARRELSKAFGNPTKQADQQQVGDVQIHISYLLGLDPTLPRQWQFIRERERTLKELKKAAGEGALGPVVGGSAELRTKIAVAEANVRRLRDSLSAFRLLEQYREIEAEADQLTREVNALTNDNSLDKAVVYELEKTLRDEAPPSPQLLDELYREVGIILPQATLRRYDEVKAFHETVVRNREVYLQQEVAAAKARVEDRERQVAEKDRRRAAIFELLNTHGALDQFLRLQSDLAKAEARVETLQQQFDALETMEGRKSELEIERNQLFLRLKQEYHEQQNILKKAILTFEGISSQLYEDAGSLTIHEAINGPQFDFHIHGIRSKGISNMQIFCFDMMLMRLWADRQKGPGFLIHDSHLFDGVDRRQVATAIQAGAKLAADGGWQYVITMNSDALPFDLLGGGAFERYILPTRLNDRTEDGGLFGIRFD